MTDREKHLEAIAKKAWELAHEAAIRKGFARVPSSRGEGRVIPGQVARFVRDASSLVGGEPLMGDDVRTIRRLLRDAANMVVLGEITGKTTEKLFRIFVAEQYGTHVTPKGKREPDSIDKRAAKLTEHEAGEDREPARVVVRHPKKSAGNHTPLSDKQVDILVALAAADGVIESSNGRAAVELASRMEGGVKNSNSSLVGLEKRGFIRRTTRGKRTYEIVLTKEGEKAVRNLRKHVKAEDAVLDFLKRHGTYRAPGNSSRNMASALAKDVGIKEHAAADALRKLYKAGLVHAELTEGSDPNKRMFFRAVAAKIDAADPVPVTLEKPEVDKSLPPEFLCRRCKGVWGRDKTCERCTYENGETRPYSDAGPDAPFDMKRLDPPERLLQKAVTAETPSDWKSRVVLLIEEEVSRQVRAEAEKPNTELDEAKATLELIKGVVADATEGKRSPLKALGDIEAILS